MDMVVLHDQAQHQGLEVVHSTRSIEPYIGMLKADLLGMSGGSDCCIQVEPNYALAFTKGALPSGSVGGSGVGSFTHQGNLATHSLTDEFLVVDCIHKRRLAGLHVRTLVC